MTIQHFYDQATGTLTYVVYDLQSHDAVIIDPVLDYDAAAGKVTEVSAQKLVEFVKKNELRVHYVLETHAHADHLTGAQALKRSLSPFKLAIGAKITEVQKTFAQFLNLESHIACDGSQFDQLLNDGDVISAGTLKIKVIPTPGHTVACVSYQIEDALFCGDAIFMPDSGTGRCDFPGGSAETLYRTITERIYTLPDSTRIFVGHDYQPDGRDLQFQTTVRDEKMMNIQLNRETSKDHYIQFRQNRDKTLQAPKLLWPSLQVNIAAGQLPPAESNGTRYIRVPLS